jgi:tryptophan 6-halogenase
MSGAQAVRHIIIVGGGTAGWMTANLLARRLPSARITLVESPEVGIIGVGEGSTPQLRALFSQLGLAEEEWMPKCNATYKVGIRFDGWSERPGFESYFHPFATSLDSHTAPIFFYNTRARRTGRDVFAHPDRYFLPARLAESRQSPVAPEHFPFDVSYGYHFDAYLVGAMLREEAIKVGVNHVARHIAEVQLDELGAIRRLNLADGAFIDADFFVDCSGFQSLLLQQALNEPFLSFKDNLFNDSAVVMPTATDPEGPRPQTRATALSCGWAWEIPLTTRVGNGYVYASDHISAAQAEEELRRHLGLLESDVNARQLKMKVGRVRNSWTANCLAVGLAQGFIEPLEATALHIVQATVEEFMDAWEAGGFSPSYRDQFNKTINARYDGIRDYIVAHYRMNQRSDTDYWIANAQQQNLSDSLRALMTSWFRGEDLEAEVMQQNISGYYAPLSWHCLFAGYGTFPDDTKLSLPGNDIQQFDLAQVDEFLRRCALNFRSHDQQLARSRPFPFLIESLAVIQSNTDKKGLPL